MIRAPGSIQIKQVKLTQTLAEMPPCQLANRSSLQINDIINCNSIDHETIVELCKTDGHLPVPLATAGASASCELPTVLQPFKLQFSYCQVPSAKLPFGAGPVGRVQRSERSDGVVPVLEQLERA